MVNQNEIRYLGVDGCPYGWFSVGFNRAGHYEVNAFPTFAGLLEHYANAQLILVDIPIGLPDGPGERQCDPEARALLNQNGGSLGSRVFRAPARAAVKYLAHHTCHTDVVEAAQHELAETVESKLRKVVQPDITRDFRREIGKAVRYEITKAIQREITGRSLPTQTLEIVPKIDEVDNLLPRDEAPYIREVHPEICFWACNDKKPVRSSKSTEGGIEERIQILSQNRIEPRSRQIYQRGLDQYRRNDVHKDDILDALAAAVTAYRVRNIGDPPTLPEGRPPQIDAKRLPMEMVYWVP